jgi:hypothetical protein
MEISSKGKSYIANLLLLIASLILVLSVCEVIARIAVHQKESVTLEEALRLGKIGGGEGAYYQDEPERPDNI